MLITENPDAVMVILTALISLFGLDRWRTKVRESTVAEVDRWASTAAGVVVLAITSGLLTDHEEAINRFLKHFRLLAAALGVKVKPEHEARALAMATEVFQRAGQGALIAEAEKLKLTAEAAMARMAKLPWPK